MARYLSLSWFFIFGFTMALVQPSNVDAADNQTEKAGRPQDWPQWRGPSRDGHVAGSDWPDSLTEENCRQIWRIPLGPSYSGPIVAADRVFVTETKDKKTEIVRALSRESGQELWQVQWPGSLSVPFFAASNGSWIRATPAYDGSSIYVAGMKDVLVCLAAADGKERWRLDFVAELKTALPAFGFVSSPLIQGDHLYVQAGMSLVKIDKASGKISWRSLEENDGMMASAFSSPVLATVTGRQQLLVQTRQDLCGVNPESGEVLWKQTIPSFRGMNILTPTVVGNDVFTSSYGGGTNLYAVTGNTDGLQVASKWETKSQGYMSSPVVIDGYLYLHLRNQRFTCIELTTGKEMWTTKPFGKYWSLVAQKDKIMALDAKGDLLLIRANPEKFDLLGSRKVSDDETWAHLAVSGDELYVRELNAIAKYRWGAQ